ncbi:MAG: FkbM family methyltransferase [Candidatus Korobacteraceae bacterium]
MKRLGHWLADQIGCRIVPRWRVAGLPAAQRLQEVFAKRQIDRVIDVGANEGQFYKFLRLEVGFTGQIVSFEPIPELAARLQERSTNDSSWTVHACALGATAGELTLNVTAKTAFSSFLLPLALDPDFSGNVVERTIRVPVSTLDEMFPDPIALRHTYLKLDTQGFDLEVAGGGERTLETIPALQTEVSFSALYDGMPDYQKSLSVFNQYGFHVSDFFVVAARSDGIACEFDCIMLRAPGATTTG